MPHWLAAQVAVAFGLPAQILPQIPQLSGSVVVSTQAPPHSMAGSKQAKSHVPSRQVAVAFAGGIQTVVQLPQCPVLVITSTQEPSQLVVVPPQVEPQSLSVQTSLLPHSLLQLPQWALFDVRSTHSPSHFS